MLRFLNMRFVIFPFAYVPQPIIKTLFQADGSNMARSTSVPGTFDPLFFRAGRFWHRTGEILTTLANSEYPDGYCENPYRRFHNVNL